MSVTFDYFEKIFQLCHSSGLGISIAFFYNHDFPSELKKTVS
jgi:hypothetical protein